MKISKVRLRSTLAVNLLYSVLRVYGFEFHLSTADASNNKSQAVGPLGPAAREAAVAMVRHALQNFLTKLALGTLLTCGPHFAAKLLYSALRVYELDFFFLFPRGAKQLPSGGIVRSRPPLAQAARGSGLPCSSNIYQAVGTLSNCGHHFAAICGIPLSVLMDLNFIGPPPRLPTNSQAGGSFGLAPRLHRLRGAMVHHAPRNFPKTLRAVGTLLACGQHLAAIFRIPLSLCWIRIH